MIQGIGYKMGIFIFYNSVSRFNSGLVINYNYQAETE